MPLPPFADFLTTTSIGIDGYDVVDLDEVWLVLEKDLPTLLKQLEPLLPRRGA